VSSDIQLQETVMVRLRREPSVRTVPIGVKAHAGAVTQIGRLPDGRHGNRPGCD
jgi:hypothetical protein